MIFPCTTYHDAAVASAPSPLQGPTEWGSTSSFLYLLYTAINDGDRVGGSESHAEGMDVQGPELTTKLGASEYS